MKKLKKKLFLFDLDGVLFDTKKNMEKSWNLARDKFNLKKNFNEYFIHLGLPFNVIMKKLGIKKKYINIINEFYKKKSLENNHLIKIYPGVKSTLNKLKKNNIEVGIVTSKDFYRTKKIILNYKLNFSIIETPRKGLRGKPYPDPILRVIKRTGYLKKDIIYVGDTYNDYLSAKFSKIKFIFAAYGYGKYKKDIKYYRKINKFSDIISFIKNE